MNYVYSEIFNYLNLFQLNVFHVTFILHQTDCILNMKYLFLNKFIYDSFLSKIKLKIFSNLLII